MGVGAPDVGLGEPLEALAVAAVDAGGGVQAHVEGVDAKLWLVDDTRRRGGDGRQRQLGAGDQRRVDVGRASCRPAGGRKQRRRPPSARKLGRAGRVVVIEMRLSFLVLLSCSLLGCGIAAHPLSHRGIRVEPGAAEALVPSRTAWLTCFGGKYREVPTGVIVVSGYRNCRIVVTEASSAVDAGIPGALRLGPADNLRKVDVGALAKGLVRHDTLHLIVTYTESDRDRDVPIHEQVACHERGIGFDFDCPRESVMLVLGHDGIAEVEVWNRYSPRWR